MYSILKNVLFLLPPEQAHHVTTSLLRFFFKIPGIKSLISSFYHVNNPKLNRSLFGLNFPSPVGLAAGFDKNAELMHEMEAFGFGFVEIGTITPKPQPGNPKPRLFRLPEDEGLINRMGFNNKGMEVAANYLKNRPKNLIVGGNIGKNKSTPNEQAKDDYVLCFDALHRYVDYFVINVSSPNTPDLRQLQDKKPLKEIIVALQTRNTELKANKPILLKIAPDLNNAQLDDILEIADETELDGLIATNTTISWDKLKTGKIVVEKIGAGGLSGKPVQNRSTEVIKYLRERNKSIPIIGVGGIHDAASAMEKLEAGANLVQVYTGFIYEGPALIKRINKTLVNYV